MNPQTTNQTTNPTMSFSNQFNVSPNVSANNMVNQPTPVSLPTPQNPTSPFQFVDGMSGVIESGNQGVQNLQQQIVQAQTQEASQRNNILNQLLSIDGQDTQRVYDRAFGSNIRSMTGQDPDTFMQQLTDANMALATLQGKFRTAGQRISSGQGQSKVFESAQLNELDRQKAVEVGNQALIVQALQGNFDTARQIALDTANFASEDKKTELNNLLKQYDALTGIVDQQTQQLLDQEKQKVQMELMDTERTQNLVDSAIVAGVATVEEMQHLTSTEVDNATKQRIAMEIINRGGAADRAFQNRKEFGLGGTSSNITASDIPQGVADPKRVSDIINSIRQSSGNKGRLTQTQEEQVITAQNVVGQIGNILELASNKTLPKDQAESIFGAKTGVVAGRINKLKSKLGSNPDAAALNGSITGLIPKVARGVFGEVGVLTDTDIKRYEATVPNMFLPENANEAVSVVLLDSLARSFGNQLEVWSKSRDVSSFESIYLNLLEESNAIKRGLGATNTQTPQQMTVNGQTYTLGADGKYYAQ